ncbi:hypothetical protein HanPI659440_Chr13g0512891 [Helianthus annuus]|nr:hypothetical protein HanPI659440_Chr13g0512881 [Helianthus annuus]KAJ0716450.1 hypothetical protein HanPI659440_Chr13g0512891 [Helianthus annuus]
MFYLKIKQNKLKTKHTHMCVCFGRDIQEPRRGLLQSPKTHKNPTKSKIKQAKNWGF